MAEYVTKEQIIDWYRPYGHTDEPIPFETLVSDLRDMKATDVAPVRHGQWVPCDNGGYYCSYCDHRVAFLVHNRYCPNCGAKMDLEG